MDKRFRVAIFARTVSGHRSGQTLTGPDSLAGALTARGHSVTIITTSLKDTDPDKGFVEGVAYESVDEAPADAHSDEFWHGSARHFDLLHAGQPFDVAISQTAAAFGWTAYSDHASTVPLIARAPNSLSRFVNSLRAVPDRRFRFWQKPLAERRLRRFYNRHHLPVLKLARAVTTDTELGVKFHVEDLPEIADRVVAIPRSTVASSPPDPGEVSELKDRLGLSDSKLVGYLGRLSPEKGVDRLIDTAPLISHENATVLLMGPGPEWYVDKLRDRVEPGSDVRFLGPVAHDEVSLYLSLLDVMVVPSIVDGGSKTVFEGFYMRRPIVATNVDVLPELITHGENGYLVESGDHVAMAQRIDQLLADPELARRFGDHGHKTVQHRNSGESMGAAYEKLIAQVVSAAGSPE